MADEPTKNRCSFCKRPQNEVKHLLSNENKESPVFICNRCIGESGRALSAADRQAKSSDTQFVKKPNEIKAFLDEFVISQEDAKREIAIAVYEHAKRREVFQSGGTLMIENEEGQSEEVEVEKSNILLMGPSGTGKTHIARSVARMLNLPFYVGDATRLTTSGYVGDDVESLLQGLIADASGDLERAQWGIIFIDEFDKLARKSGRSASGYRDITGEGVQQALLKLIEGTQVSVPRGMGAKMVVSGSGGTDLVDTTNILFICSGSFAGIEEVVERRVNKASRMGFGGDSKKDLDKTAVYKQVVVEDIEEFGLIPEMVGRLPVITSTYELTEDDLIEILTKPKNAVLKQFQATFGLEKVTLQFDKAALRAIAKKAVERSTGARALRSIVKQVLKPYSFDVPTDDTIAAIQITEDAVNEPGTAKIVRKEAAATA